MKPFMSSILVFLLLAGCGKKPDEGKRDETGEKSGGKTDVSTQYNDQPYSYWIERAASGPADDTDTVIAALIHAVENGTEDIRRDAADALGGFGPRAEKAAAPLVQLLAHERPWIRVAAMETLKEIGEKSVPPLIDAFKTGTTPVRVRSGIVLGTLGKTAKDALPVLKKALNDESEVIRGFAVKFIAQIDPDAEKTPTETTVEKKPAIKIENPVLPAAGKTHWPQFHGPHRNSLSGDTGLLQKWPEKGPELLWKVEGLGRGYSSVSIAGGRLFTMGDRKTSGGGEAQFLIAYDLAARNELWAVRVGPPHADGGPRSTPTIDENAAYAIGTSGDLVCVDVASGQEKWRKSFTEDFDGTMMSGWKYSESPLVDGEKVVCTPGGAESTIVALDKKTGEPLWEFSLPDIGEKGSDGAGYSSIIAADICSVRQYIQLLGRGVVGIEADSGRLLWSYNDIANSIANIPTPVAMGDHVFVTTAYNTGASLLKITRNGDTLEAEEVYFIRSRDFQNHHGGVVFMGGYIYGGSGGNKGIPTCIEAATGKIAWQDKPPPERGSASVVYADGNIIFRYDRGLVMLVEATPDAFRVKGRFTPVTAEGPAWAHPVVAGGRLYLRHDTVLACYDLRKKEK